MEKTSYGMREPLASAHHHHLLCWKSVFGGLLISLMAFAVLCSLGAGVAGLRAESLISKDADGSTLATLGGLWLGLSIVISLFSGSYFALRISRFVTNKVGAAHGFVIASLFFGLMLTGAGGMFGGLAQGFGRLAQNNATTQNLVAQDNIYKALGTSNLKSSPDSVAAGLMLRLVQGDTESAKAFYTYQTGMTGPEADAKFNQLKGDFDASVKSAEEKAARALGDAGLTLFVTFIVGLVGALIGGRVGAHANISRPFAEAETVRTFVPAEAGRVL